MLQKYLAVPFPENRELGVVVVDPLHLAGLELHLVLVRESVVIHPPVDLLRVRIFQQESRVSLEVTHSLFQALLLLDGAINLVLLLDLLERLLILDFDLVVLVGEASSLDLYNGLENTHGDLQVFDVEVLGPLLLR